MGWTVTTFGFDYIWLNYMRWKACTGPKKYISMFSARPLSVHAETPHWKGLLEPNNWREGGWWACCSLCPCMWRSWKSCTDSDFALSSLWIEAGRKGKPSAKKRVQANCKSLPGRRKMVQLFHFGRGKLSVQPTKRTSDEIYSGKIMRLLRQKWYLCDKRWDLVTKKVQLLRFLGRCNEKEGGGVA